MVRDAAAPPPGAQDRGPLAARVFAQLSDGRFHSGAELAPALGGSRRPVLKATGALKELGATLHAVRNRGYRLASGGEALEAEKIREGLARDVREHVAGIEVVWSTGWTNTALLSRGNPPPG